MMLAFLGSCEPRDSEKNPCWLNTQVHPEKLLEGELSYSQYEKYANLSSDPSFHWIERNTYPDKGGLSVDRLEVRRKFLGHMGKLEYVFYFRRLAEMRFHPDNPSLFFQTAGSKGLPASNGAELGVGDVKFWATGRRDAMETFGVSDTRITRTLLACVAAYD
jgi:hypothetical protein